MTGQAEFHAALLDPERPVPPGLIDPARRPAGRRFDVYRNNVAVSLTKALEQGFPLLRDLLGTEFFQAMAGVFLRAHPPQSRMLMFYGAEMPAFLTGFPPVAHLPYLADVARLELALRESYHAADAAPLAHSDLADLSAEEFMAARFGLSPALRLIRSDWPVHGIWSAHARGTPAPSARRPEDVVILRPGLDPAPHLLPAGGAAFITALAAGATVAEALEAAGPLPDLSGLLSILIGGGALTALTRE
ncbi:DUF2063 domain-containing protein [Aliigemmobacter aestuarii]|uniref:DUF2063 domain-containing protein n=1 Tax=Aliigemmobacter aestuarii TaxID=1445661 RepID=A0A4S3MQ49_9RHOB|nr:DNA-binding domain-containing protein [Gemmobacter aestuarii]THD84626.1 DUF2063 domain-containing protein [Gemmobacter aestuarii]